MTGVSTSEGDIECEYVVNCAGMWARQLGERNGVVIPLQAAEHYYLITEPIDGVDPAWPVFEDPSRHGYYREEGGGLMVGLFEPVCAPWNVDGIPSDFSFGEITPDWDRMGPYVERAMERVPITLEAGIRTFFCGPESFTPDLAPIVGEAPGLDNYFVAAGMNSVGILTGGGMGRIVAQWIVDGRPDVDVTGFNIDRMQDYQLNPRYRAERTVETLGMVYQTHFPGRSMETARGVKRSPDARSTRRAARLLPRRERLGGRRLVRPRRESSHAWTSSPGVGRTGSRTGRRSTAPCARASGSWTCRSCRSSRSRVRTRDGSSTASPRTRSTASPASSPTPSGSTTGEPSRPTSP